MVLENDKVNKCEQSSCKKIVKNDCFDCEKFKRKIEENEQTVSARDVLIEMSQKEIQKLQNLYKNSIDDYENLRFTYCSIVQDLTNLKDIHNKLEKENKNLVLERNSLNAELKQFKKLQEQLDYWKNQYEQLQKDKTNCDCASGEKVTDKNVQQEILSIQNIMQSQNQSFKLTLSKFLDDLKQPKSQQRNDKSCQALCATVEIEGSCRGDIENLNRLVEKLEVENKKIKENLNNKQTHLYKCLNVLEKNHSDIGNLSGHIENICHERDKCLQAIDEKDQEISRLKSELNFLKKSTENIEDLKLEKERYFQENKKLRSVIDTFRRENDEKNKMIDEAISEKENLHNELGSVRRMSEQLQAKIQEKEIDSKLAKEFESEVTLLRLENEKFIEKINFLNTHLDERDEEAQHHANRNELYAEEIKKLKYIIDVYKEKERELDKQYDDADNDDEDDKEIALKNRIQQLQENVEDLTETLGVVTEENKSNLKTIDELRKNLNESRIDQECSACNANDKVRKLQNEIEELKNQLVTAKSSTNKPENKNELEQLKEKIKTLEKDLETANLEISEYEEENKCYRQKLEAMMKELSCVQEEKLRIEDDTFECCERMNQIRQDYSKLVSEKDYKIKELQEEIQHFVNNKTVCPTSPNTMEKLVQEKERIENENKQLSQRIVTLEKELQEALDGTGEKITLLEEKINLLEGQNEEVQKKLNCYCSEMNRIKTTLHEDSVTKEKHVKELESKCMGQDVEILKLRNINLEQAQEIDNLNNSVEIYQKQISKCSCNGSEMKELNSAYESFRTKIDDLEDELCKKKCVIISLEKCIDRSNKILGECEDEIRRINAENEKLKNDLDHTRVDLERCKYEVEVHKADKNLLQERSNQSMRKSEQLEMENSRLLRKMSEDKEGIEGKISILQKKYNKLLEESEEKNIELQKIKKQFQVLQSCCKSPSITKEEFQKMKKVSREIKGLLIEQSKKLNDSPPKSCQSSRKPDEVKTNSFVDRYVTELEAKIKEKDTDLKNLESKNECMLTEIVDLKQNVHRMMLDNVELKKVITNLLNTVINKIKLITDSGESLNMESTKNNAASGILQSLMSLEKNIMEDTKPSGCPIAKCNCMSVISARYNVDENEPVESCSCADQCACIDKTEASKFSIGNIREIVNQCIVCCEEKLKPEKEQDSKKECTRNVDDCLECRAPCADVGDTVPCPE